VQSYVKPASAGSPAEGKKVVFTGTLGRMDRKDAEAHAESLGAKIVGSVSRQTDIVVYGPGAGSKLQKADALIAAGAPLRKMTEDEWWDYVGAPVPADGTADDTADDTADGLSGPRP